MQAPFTRSLLGTVFEVQLGRKAAIPKPENPTPKPKQCTGQGWKATHRLATFKLAADSINMLDKT